MYQGTSVNEDSELTVRTRRPRPLGLRDLETTQMGRIPVEEITGSICRPQLPVERSKRGRKVSGLQMTPGGFPVRDPSVTTCPDRSFSRVLSVCH